MNRRNIGAAETKKKRGPTPSKIQRMRIRELTQAFVTRLQNAFPEIYEGAVMSAGQPYRRMDCDMRALAYLRERPRRNGLRIDVSGLWYPRGLCALSIPGSVGSASLMVHSEEEIEPAIWFLVETVQHSRKILRSTDEEYLGRTG